MLTIHALDSLFYSCTKALFPTKQPTIIIHQLHLQYQSPRLSTRRSSATMTSNQPPVPANIISLPSVRFIPAPTWQALNAVTEYLQSHQAPWMGVEVTSAPDVQVYLLGRVYRPKEKRALQKGLVAVLRTLDISVDVRLVEIGKS